MKRLTAVLRLSFWMTALFATAFLSQAESRDKRPSTTQQKKTSAHEIHLVDQNGRPAVNGVPSATSQIVDVAAGEGGGVFVPGSVNISGGDTGAGAVGVRGPRVSRGPPCLVPSHIC